MYSRPARPLAADAAAGRALGGASRAGRSASHAGARAGAGVGRRLELDSPVKTRMELGQTIGDDDVDVYYYTTLMPILFLRVHCNLGARWARHEFQY